MVCNLQAVDWKECGWGFERTVMTSPVSLMRLSDSTIFFPSNSMIFFITELMNPNTTCQTTTIG